MRLLKDGDFIADHWVLADADWRTLPDTADIIVPFKVLLADWKALRARPGRLGVDFANVERAEALKTFIADLDLVAVVFPSFTDGRGFSLARALRRLGFAGELRATGNVLPDQLAFLIQVGFDAVATSPRFAPETWLKAAGAMSLAYQAAPDRRHVWRARHGGEEPWFEQPHAG